MIAFHRTRRRPLFYYCWFLITGIALWLQSLPRCVTLRHTVSPWLRSALFLCAVGLPFAATVRAQTTAAPAPSKPLPLQTNVPAKAAPAPPNYSNEPYVIDQFHTNVTFANDGRYVSETIAQIRIQSPAGVQSFSLLTFPYASANATVEIPYVRVRKPDGTVVDTPPGNIQNMPASITRAAPFYSDLREKQVAVKALESGDVLEYEYRVQVKNPLIPGQFWYGYDFFKTGIVLQEELQVSVPRGRYVKVQSRDVKPTVTEQAKYTVYTWNSANLHVKPQDEKSKPQQASEPSPPSVQLTTFHTWDEVAQWFRGLEQPRSVPTPEIRAKAAELTKGDVTESQKVHAIYDYVSLKIRYVGIAFGIGRYQPHAAAEVLSNEYGDCKDKQTLLTSLLAAAGVKSYPALVNSSRKIDPAVPSPGQFDHVIAVVPNGAEFTWLDTTAEVAPFGFLTANLRNKEALVISDNGPAQLIRTPANPPFQSDFNFAMKGTLSDAGTLQGKAQASFRGDAEYLLRLAFRRTPQPQWQNVIQALSYSWSFAGKVSDISASDPDATASPFQFTYDYTRKNYSDWSNKKISPPLPALLLAGVDESAKDIAKPIKLGAPGDILLEATVALPAGFTPSLPLPVNVVQDFAEYHATYSFSNGVLHVQRHLITKMREIPRARRADYKKFVKSVRDDAGDLISLQNASAAASPYQPNPEAQKLLQQARQAWQQRDMPTALDLLQRAVTVDPKYAEAWTMLGIAHLATQDADEGLDDMKKAIAIDPKQALAYRTLAYAQLALRRPEEALATWRQLEKANPDDRDAPAQTGSILITLKRYKEAVPELETAVKRNTDNAHLFESLGLAYTKIGDSDKALTAFNQALRLNSSPGILNDAAFDLADANQHLNAALEDGNKAVQQEENLTSKISLDSLTYTDLQHMDELADFCDTLGWAHFRLGQLHQAEKFAAAAWALSQQPDIGDHLGQIYQKEGKRNEAIRLYAFALAGLHPILFMPGSNVETNTLSLGDANAMPKTRQRLTELLKSDSRAVEAVAHARDDLSQLRTIKLPKITSKSVMAEFFVLFGAGPKVIAVKFISGSDELRSATKYLTTAKYNVSFPDDGPTHIVRRGVLDCEPELSSCQFVFIPPGSVHSLD